MSMRDYALRAAVFLVGICLPIAGLAATWEHDFNNSGMGWYFGGFSGNYTTHATYLAFDSGANEQGGSGRSFGISDMTGAGEFTITARIGSGNAADGFVVKIYDNDATSSIHCWTFKSNCFNSTTFTSVTRHLNAPDYIEQAGTTEGLDLTNMRDFYINGDYSTTDAFAFDFDHIEINPTTAGYIYEFDFNNQDLEWFGGTWNDSAAHTVHADYLEINSPADSQGYGGVSGIPDLSAATHCDVNVRIGSGNTTGQFLFKLEDEDGTRVRWNIPTNTLNTSTFTTVTLKLDEPDVTEVAGTTPGLDLANPASWILNGDWSGPLALAFDFDHLEFTRAPGSVFAFR